MHIKESKVYVFYDIPVHVLMNFRIFTFREWRVLLCACSGSV